MYLEYKIIFVLQAEKNWTKCQYLENQYTEPILY